jgi:hypothetical protein
MAMAMATAMATATATAGASTPLGMTGVLGNDGNWGVEENGNGKSEGDCGVRSGGGGGGG